jgi:hypothetical protein
MYKIILDGVVTEALDVTAPSPLLLEIDLVSGLRAAGITTPHGTTAAGD